MVCVSDYTVHGSAHTFDSCQVAAQSMSLCKSADSLTCGGGLGEPSTATNSSRWRGCREPVAAERLGRPPGLTLCAAERKRHSRSMASPLRQSDLHAYTGLQTWLLHGRALVCLCKGAVDLTVTIYAGVHAQRRASKFDEIPMVCTQRQQIQRLTIPRQNNTGRS